MALHGYGTAAVSPATPGRGLLIRSMERTIATSEDGSEFMSVRRLLLIGSERLKAVPSNPVPQGALIPNLRLLKTGSLFCHDLELHVARHR